MIDYSITSSVFDIQLSFALNILYGNCFMCTGKKIKYYSHTFHSKTFFFFFEHFLLLLLFDKETSKDFILI
jgi:hypothetical protein